MLSLHRVTSAGGLEHQCLLRNPVFKQSFQNRQEIKKTTDKQKTRKPREVHLQVKLNTEFKIIYDKKQVFAGICGSRFCSNALISGQITELVYGHAVFCLLLV